MKNYGKCHICGKKTQLTFEHIPPEKANNSDDAHAILGDTLMNHIGSTRQPWDLTGLRYKNLQRGMGGYTLCEACNNNTGAWYADDYINFVNTIGYVLTNKVDLEKVKAVKIELKEMHPLRIFKQIICMFASTMHAEFFDAHPALRDFILNKESTNFDPKKYRISMYILKEPHCGWSGLNAMLYGNGKIKTVAYMDLYPVGFILEIDPTEDTFEYVSDITNMGTDFTYNDKGILGVTLNILERNTLWVGDFRSKEDILKQSKKSRIDTIEIIKDEMNRLNIKEEKYKSAIDEYINNQISSSEFFNRIEQIKGEN